MPGAINVGNYQIDGSIDDSNYIGYGLNLLSIIGDTPFRTNKPMSIARADHTATLMTNGKVLVTGGMIYDKVSNQRTYFNSAEQYDPATDNWTPAAPMLFSRSSHTALLLANGTILISGDYNNLGAVGMAEIYSPVNNTWKVGGASESIGNGTATLLLDGKVLLVGGSYSQPSGGILPGVMIYLPNADVFNPTGYSATQGTWGPTSPLITRRCLHTATALSNGKVLIAGGYNGTLLSSAELYDPATGNGQPRHRCTTVAPVTQQHAFPMGS
jgi:Kelch motif/Galactose oxidase, central domain